MCSLATSMLVICWLGSSGALHALIYTKGGRGFKVALKHLCSSDLLMMACRVCPSTSCHLSTRRSSRDSRHWRGRFREGPWPSWQSFSTTSSMLPMLVSHLPAHTSLLSDCAHPELPRVTGPVPSHSTDCQSQVEGQQGGKVGCSHPFLSKLFYVYRWFAYVCCLYHVCAWCLRRHLIPWYWNYRLCGPPHGSWE